MRASVILCFLSILACNSSLAASGSVVADLATSCSDSTSTVQRISLPLTLNYGRSDLCLDRSTFVRGLAISDAKIWKDEKANVWWLIVKFDKSAAPLVKGALSRATGHEIALVRGRKVVISGLVAAVPNDAELGFTTESKEDAQKLVDSLR